MRRIHCGVLIALLLVFVLGCGERRGGADVGTAKDTARNTTSGSAIVFLAAASTTDAVEEIAEEFERRTGARVRISAGPSNALAAQIAAAAPADLFLSASDQWADYLGQQGLAKAVTPLLTNDLVIIVPPDNPANVQSAADLVKPGVKRVALAGENVPAGIYAEQALRALALYQPLADAKKIVRGQDVRVTLGYVGRGEADAGIVYSTDASIDGEVSIVDRFDPRTHDRIVYSLVLIKRERPNAMAAEFYEFLQSSEAARVCEKFGFDLVAEK